METGPGVRAIAVKFELIRDNYSLEEDGREIDHLHARDIPLTVGHEGAKKYCTHLDVGVYRLGRLAFYVFTWQRSCWSFPI